MTTVTDRGTHGVHVRNIFTPQLLDQCIACGFCLPTCPTYGRPAMSGSRPGAGSR